jgi:competence ComEA-like helix-hairpin-helix protein
MFCAVGPTSLLEHLHRFGVLTHTRRTVMLRMMVPLAAAACLLAVHTSTLSAQSKPASRTTTAKPAAGKVVNINTASVAELNGLPGIGAKTAALIVEYRQKNGPFKKIEEILESSRSCPYSLNASCFDPSRLSPGVAKSLSKSRRDSRVVGALVGAPRPLLDRSVWLRPRGSRFVPNALSPEQNPLSISLRRLETAPALLLRGNRPASQADR